MPDEVRERSPLTAAFVRLGRTFREIRRYRHAFLFFLSMLLYQDGIQTIIRMAAVYGAEIGIEQTAQIAAFVMVQFLGIPFAFLFGSLGARIGTKRAHLHRARRLRRGDDPRLLHDDRRRTSSSSRRWWPRCRAAPRRSAARCSRGMIPVNKTSEFFGFFAVAERFATVLGPLVFTLSVALTGSSRIGGARAFSCSSSPAPVLLSLVDEEGGRARRGAGRDRLKRISGATLPAPAPCAPPSRTRQTSPMAPRRCAAGCATSPSGRTK